MEGKGALPFYLFPLSPPKKIYLNLQFFPLALRSLLYHGSRPLLTHSLPFPWPINYDCASWVTSLLDIHCRFDFDWRSLFLSLKSWRRVWPHLMCLKLHKWTNNCF
jgi:hypothetical protein